jgi:hypothetical protein
VRRRALAFGLGAAALYLGAALLTSGLRTAVVRPLYDGLAPPPPYNWVNPPADLEEGNTRPQGTTSEVEFVPEGSKPMSVNTPDGQAVLIFQLGSFEPREAQTAVSVRITPRDAAPLPEPDGLAIDGNAYVAEATYVPSGERAPLATKASIVLRYPTHATEVLRLAGNRWTSLGGEAAPASLQLFADTTELGTFAAAGPPPGPNIPWWAFVLGGAAVAATGFELWRLRRRRAAARAAAGRAGRRRDARAKGDKRRK